MISITERFKSYLATSSSLSLIMIFMLSLFKCITRYSWSSLSLEEIKLFLIEFPMCQIVWDYLWYLFTYGLISLKQFSTDSVFYHFYFYIEYNSYFKNYLHLLVHNNLPLHVQKTSNLFSFFNQKRFLLLRFFNPWTFIIVVM